MDLDKFDWIQPCETKKMLPEVQWKWDRMLLLAAMNGNLKVCQEALASGAEINCCHFQAPCRQWTPLHHAADRGHFTIVKFLVGNGADVNAILAPHDDFPEGTYDTPRDLAVRRGYTDIADYLAKQMKSKRVCAKLTTQRVVSVQEDWCMVNGE